MQTMKERMETAFREFISEHKRVPSTRLTVIQFDDIDDQEYSFRDVPIKSVRGGITIRPRGNTPLLDAFCKAIDGTGERLSRMREADRPDQVLFVVITDGAENASREFTRQNVFDRVTRQRNSYKWQFVYMGANQDSFAEAATFNIPRGQTMNYSPMFCCEDSSYLAGQTVSYAMRNTNFVKLDETDQLKNRHEAKNTTSTDSTT